MSAVRGISLVTATPNGFNPGMLASQVSARWFLERHGLLGQARFYRVLSAEARFGRTGSPQHIACLERLADGTEYALLEHPDQFAETTPVYWGDLLHMRQYLHSLRPHVRPPKATLEQLLLLADAPENVIRRATSFGTTFLYHSASDLTDADYGPLFRRFVENARLILPRDIVSASQLAAMRPRSSVSLGLDVTQLFCGKPWRNAFPNGPDRSLARPGGLLCHFARGLHEIDDLNRAVSLFSRGFQAPVHWLPWGDPLAFPHVGRYAGVVDAEELAPAAEPPRLPALLEAVAQAKCILTDTYHAAVIAWSLGTPAIMVRGRHWPRDYNAVVDKRTMFYLQHSLQDFHLEGAHDAEAVACAIGRVVELVEEGQVLARYTATVGQRADWCERLVLAALMEE